MCCAIELYNTRSITVGNQSFFLPFFLKKIENKTRQYRIETLLEIINTGKERETLNSILCETKQSF